VEGCPAIERGDTPRFAVVADRIAAETIIAAERVPEWLKK
jgi:diaminopimelate decarboxylase